MLNKFQFVKEDPQRESDDLDESTGNTPSRVEDSLRSDREPGESSTSKQTQTVEAELPTWPSDGPSQASQPSATSFNGNDESAVAGLLALGTSTNNIMGLDLNSSTFSASPRTRKGSSGQAITPSRHLDFVTAYSPSHLSRNSQPDLGASPTQILELLRHYRYAVAPWVSKTIIPKTRGRKR